MSDCEKKANKRVKEKAFLEDYPLNEAWVFADLYSYFSRWLDTGDYDELDRVVIFCRDISVPIKGVLLDEVANVASSRLNRETQISKKYRAAQTDIPLVKDSINSGSIDRVLRLIGLCGLDAEEACFLVANWLRFRKYYTDHKATTIHKKCKEWLSKNKREKLDIFRDGHFIEQLPEKERKELPFWDSERFIEQFGMFSRDPSLLKEPSPEFIKFISAELNLIEQRIALSEHKLWSEQRRDLEKNNILDGMLTAVKSGSFQLSEDHRGKWDGIERPISHNGTKFVQS
ncbi:hypothetical protein ACNPDD_002773 [Vibrio vulnificus]|nr:hypothetical protein [Vibrio vulnificus]